MLSSRILCWKRAIVLAKLSLACVIFLCLYLFWYPSGQFRNLDVSFEYSQLSFVSVSGDSSPSDRDWRTLIPNVFVYAAHIASPEPFGQELHITAFTKIYDTSRCFCTYLCPSGNASSSNNVTERAIVESLGERHDLMRTASRFRCALPSSPVAFDTVRLTCKTKDVPKREGALEFLLSGNRSDPSIKEFSIALCIGSSLQGKYSDDPNSVIEFVEYHRLLGVGKFFLYITNVSARVLRVLEYYKRRGLVELMNWTLPFKAERVHYFGQVALINDCFLRTSRQWDFTGHLDLDEYVATTNPDGLRGALRDSKGDCLILRSSVVRDQELQNLTANEVTNSSLNLAGSSIGRVFHRSTYVFPETARTKYFCRGRKAAFFGVHSVYGMVPGIIAKVAKPEDTLLFHFRPEFDSMGDLVEDRRALAVAARAEVNMAEIRKELSLLWKTLEYKFLLATR